MVSAYRVEKICEPQNLSGVHRFFSQAETQHGSDNENRSLSYPEALGKRCWPEAVGCVDNWAASDYKITARSREQDISGGPHEYNRATFGLASDESLEVLSNGLNTNLNHVGKTKQNPY